MKREPSEIGRLALWSPAIVDESEVARNDWQRGLLLMLAAILALGWIDANDRAVEADDARQASERALHEDRALRGLPNPAIVLDARTARQYGLRLADIAGGLDAERAQLHAPSKRTQEKRP